MIFGRKKRAARAIEAETPDSPDEGSDLEDVDDPSEASPDDDSSAASPDASPSADDIEDEPDYREDGPFDIDEVDLDADEVSRIDFGSLVMTPLEGMELRLQVEERSKAIQSALVVREGSGIEVALFAAPSNGGLAGEVLADLVEITEQAGGTAIVRPGPFGEEILREVTLVDEGGKQALHRSRIWLVEGPKWMLRAVLMGGAVDDDSPGYAVMEDFFRNLVVRRGSSPLAPGALLPLEMPQDLVAK